MYTLFYILKRTIIVFVIFISKLLIILSSHTIVKCSMDLLINELRRRAARSFK